MQFGWLNSSLLNMKLIGQGTCQVNMSDHATLRLLHTHDCANDVDQRQSDIYVVFTKILCGVNFCVW